MRTLLRGAALLTAVAAALAMVLWSGPQALAGGPTSVLVVSPESKQSASLYFSDKEYDALSGLLGAPGKSPEELPPGLGVGAGRQLNVTWLLHDVQPWRMDRVYPDTPGTKAVWIHTSAKLPRSYDGYWHKAENPAELRALLRRLGVMGKRSPGGAPPIFPRPETHWNSAATASGADADAPAAPSAAAVSRSTNWWWALPGLAAGVAVTLLVRPMVARIPESLALVRRRREAGPRQELQDL
ncbi:hypothetical protein [Streptomyces sp. NPDC016845]|uniref:hypothetical protein n=1 Tax=Streptomyces sp. NPDC016845 TaxID=3364972 RepID=UPI0037B5E7A9